MDYYNIKQLFKTLEDARRATDIYNMGTDYSTARIIKVNNGYKIEII